MSYIQAVVDAIAPKSFTLKDKNGRAVARTYLQHRIDGDQEIFFIVNSDRDSEKEYVLTFLNSRDKEIVIWDCLKGTCCRAAASILGNDLRWELRLPPCGSVLLTLGDASEVCASSPALQLRACCKTQRLGDEFDFARTDPNVLTLDKISVSLDDGKTFEPEDFDRRVRKRLAEHFGITESLLWQPWVAIRKGIFNGKGGDIILRYSFLSDLRAPRACVVIEDIQKGALAVNGKSVDTSDHGWHWDRAFGKVDISDFVTTGVNIVDFKLHYDFLSEVEPAYIIGDFGVELVDPFRARLVGEQKKLRIGSWSDQGYPFYSGRMVYKSEFRAETNTHTVLRLIRPSGILYKVRVNGQDAGPIMWRPYELELTPLVEAGMNTVEIEVVSSLQNSWGPLHDKIGDDNMWPGPNAFDNEPELREEINSFNYGLLGGVEIVFS